MKKSWNSPPPLPKTIHTITKMFNKIPSVELSVFSFQSGYKRGGWGVQLTIHETS
jgi:hypothetical protein